jgi:spore germination cell wall hydrolase CwlJ-like protein
MKKYLLFLIVFIASGMTGSIGGKISPIVTGDFFYMHPQNTTASGLIEIADTVISKSLIVNDAEVTCMAKNIFYEAAIESTAGKLAVAHVTLNRVDSKWFPNSVCEVVYDGPHYTGSNGKQFPVRDRCQFSWYCDGKGDDPREGSRLWEDSQELAKYVLLRQEELPDITDGALHYHASYIAAPRWTARKKITTKIDTHIFYRTTSMRL